MTWFEQVLEWIKTNTGITYFPIPGVSDVLDVLFVTVVLYLLLVWFRKTRAWTLLKGVAILVLIFVVSTILKMNVTSFILQNTFIYGVLALVIVFQPEIRKALERLGHGGVFSLFNSSSKVSNYFSAETLDQIIAAMEAMQKTKTGALICIERDVRLGEYIQTGIEIDAVVSDALLVNIFEKNTPLHDGAVIIRGNRVVAATCYLPLSENMTLSKEMGTRHRAAVGLTEASDAIVLVVSEETGAMSMVVGGEITRNIDRSTLRNAFIRTQEHEQAKIEKLRKPLDFLKKALKKEDENDA